MAGLACGRLARALRDRAQLAVIGREQRQQAIGLAEVLPPQDHGVAAKDTLRPGHQSLDAPGWPSASFLGPNPSGSSSVSGPSQQTSPCSSARMTVISGANS